MSKKKPVPNKNKSVQPQSPKGRPSPKKVAQPKMPMWMLATILLVAVAVIGVVAVVLMNQNQASSKVLPAAVSVQEAYQLYNQGAFVLDVREQFEWDEFHIPNTTLIPLGELPSRLSELDKNRQIVVVCRSGNRSQEGRDILLQAGFNATSMNGGVTEWRSADYPVE
ncbi:MAG: rhodanese-like domain-containing protein [Anaerolineales bacterium]|nr:rhodanese-like domain-containing protein [Anaerolineales bacterium]